MELTNKIVLCSDLDRTILPNGDQFESPQARSIFRIVMGRPEIDLAYVSGRDQQLIKDAIAGYDLPLPNYAISDVGTAIYEVHGGRWIPYDLWSQEIAQDWQGRSREEITHVLTSLKGLTLQGPEKQNRFKLSYYVDLTDNMQQLVEKMQHMLNSRGINARIISSVDEQRRTGLIDILPKRASKENAIRYLLKENGYLRDRVVFAGDSGNDLDVLTSEIQAVLVKNASHEVRQKALETITKTGHQKTLYLARGDFMGMNGNYSAGVLEGLAHFVPDVTSWIEAAASSSDILF